MKDINKYLIEKLSLSSNSKFKRENTFAGLAISSGPVYYSKHNFKISNSWKDNDSYKKKFGLKNGSYYFNWDQCHNIEINDYMLPTKDEWNKIINGPRKGSVVNDNKDARYALIQLTGVSHAGSSTPNGLLLFPDDETISGKTLSGINNTTQTIGVTEEELNEYLDQGCVFLPASGNYYNDDWNLGGYYGGYWSSTGDNTSSAYTFDFNDADIYTDNYTDYKSDLYLPILFVKE